MYMDSVRVAVTQLVHRHHSSFIHVNYVCLGQRHGVVQCMPACDIHHRMERFQSSNNSVVVPDGNDARRCCCCCNSFNFCQVETTVVRSIPPPPRGGLFGCGDGGWLFVEGSYG